VLIQFSRYKNVFLALQCSPSTLMQIPSLFFRLLKLFSLRAALLENFAFKLLFISLGTFRNNYFQHPHDFQSRQREFSCRINNNRVWLKLKAIKPINENVLALVN
jgi:hypothetical protein